MKNILLLLTLSIIFHSCNASMQDDWFFLQQKIVQEINSQQVKSNHSFENQNTRNWCAALISTGLFMSVIKTLLKK